MSAQNSPDFGPGRGPRLGEFELIARFFAPLSKTHEGAFGLKDDVALFDVTPGCQVVAKTDQVVEGVHFRAADPPDLVARKALRVTLSDLAAKGARPLGFLQALTLHDGIDDTYLERFAAGLAADIAEFRVPLVGGDTTSGPGPLAITVTVLGEVRAGTALLRSGARVEDVVCVSGTIGDSALGLACLEGRLDMQDALAARYLLPQPRLSVGQALRGIATAALDISDGLLADLGHLAAASRVDLQIDREKVPLSFEAQKAVAGDDAWWEKILAGGDDYEIAFTAPPSRLPDIAALARQHGVALTTIGAARAGSGRVHLSNHGNPLVIASTGYRHR